MPNEARELHQTERDQSVETLFRNAIKDGDKEAIEKWDKLRKSPLIKSPLSN
jgi:hypothetical protein